MLPGMLISVNNTAISERASNRATASSASPASSATKPACSTNSTASSRKSNSSSTIKTTAGAVADTRSSILLILDYPGSPGSYPPGRTNSSPSQRNTPAGQDRGYRETAE